MSIASDSVAGPPDSLLFRRRVRLFRSLRDIWRIRGLIRTLAERELRARYKQTLLGFGWALIMPVVLMIVFTVFLQRAVEVDTRGVPSALWTYVGVLPWSFFSNAVSRAGTSLTSNFALLNKVYCPREAFPLANLVTAGVDSAISTAVLLVLFAFTGFVPHVTAVWVPLLLVIQLVFTVGIGLLTAALTVYIRDLRHGLSLILQLLLFATPVGYSIDLSGAIEHIYSVANPLASVIEGYRRTILFGQAPDIPNLALAAVSSVLILIGSYWLFKRLETGIADVA